MKKLLTVVCCAVCVLMSSCHKDSKVIPQDFYFRSLKNGAAWAGEGSAGKILGDSIRITGFKPIGEEQIYIDIKFNGTGKYILGPGQAKFFTTIGMDVLTSEYRLDVSQNNTFFINSYDTKTNIITGSCDLYFLKNSPDNDHMNFTSSSFRVKLPE